ncbi:MAG: hypothetical protein K6F57_00130 [Candidatus Saccharibacteria bacterium]|nr:hypothetical protein [Candidatus Saccharibacteria bacterium]
MTIGKSTLDATSIIMHLISDVKARETTILTERDKKRLNRASNKLEKAQGVIKKISKENDDYKIMILLRGDGILIGAFERTIRESALSEEWTPEQLRLLESLADQVVYSFMIA